jgi:hypothetical protein
MAGACPQSGGVATGAADTAPAKLACGSAGEAASLRHAEAMGGGEISRLRARPRLEGRLDHRHHHPARRRLGADRELLGESVWASAGVVTDVGAIWQPWPDSGAAEDHARLLASLPAASASVPRHSCWWGASPVTRRGERSPRSRRSHIIAGTGVPDRLRAIAFLLSPRPPGQHRRDHGAARKCEYFYSITPTRCSTDRSTRSRARDPQRVPSRRRRIDRGAAELDVGGSHG